MLLIVLLRVLLLTSPTPLSTPSTAPSPENPIWHFFNSQFANTLFMIIIGLVTIIVAILGIIIAYRLARRRKEITWRVNSDSFVVPNTEVKNRVEIRLDGITIQDLSLITLQIWNSGNVPIIRDDYIHPIKLHFQRRTVLDAYISERVPKTLMTEDEIKTFRYDNVVNRSREPMLVMLPKIHLNSQKRHDVLNSYTIKVILTGPQGDVNIVQGFLNDGKINKAPTLEVKNSLFASIITILILIATLILLGFSIYVAYSVFTSSAPR